MKRTAVACLFAIFPSLLLAQAPASQGLDSLSDQRLMQELASRGLNNLLDRAFEVNNVAPAQRESMRTIISLRQLGEGGAKMSSAERQRVVQTIASGISNVLPAMTDPQVLMDYAASLT